ncbi:MAG: LytR/AlgR family response regulator transcription factor [Bacteroidia bacterium]
MNCIIVDDEEMARMSIAKMMERIPFLNLIHTCSSAAEALQVLNSEPVDLIFLDIEMPGMSGLELLSLIKEGDVQVIVVTAGSKYASQAFEFEVSDFLEKPFTEARFLKSIARVKKKHNALHKSEDRDLFVKAKSRLVKLNTQQILYIEAVGNHVSIYTATDRYIVLSTLKAIESKFPDNKFMRVHNSFIVRVDQINSVEENLVILGKKSVPVSRAHWKNLMDRLNTL